MNERIETALVIGATSDIGRAIARALAEDSCALQLALLPARGDERGPGRGRSISTASSFPSTGSRRGTASTGGRGSSSMPKGESAAGVAALLECVAATGQGSFLAVLKLFGPVGEGLMSFPMEGYTLALDFPVRSGTAALLDGLDEITHRHGGRVYLAKDARCAPERVREGYPRLGTFEAVHAEAAGAPPRFASALSQRLAL